MKPTRKLLLAVVALCFVGLCVAQFRPPDAGGRFSGADPFGGSRFSGEGWGGGPFIRIEGGGVINEDTVRTAREIESHSTGTPNWTNAPGFERDVFTFARVIFKSDANVPDVPGWGRGRRFGWWVDFPDADLNLSFRLQQTTSMKVDPDGRTIKLSDPALFDYPFIHMEHAGYINLRDDEVTALRRYLRCGGALVVNDFWSQREWEGFERQMKIVLPDRDWVDLATDHPVFNCVYDLTLPMQHLQVPTIQFWNPAHNPSDSQSPPLQRVFRGEGSEEMHVRTWLDDKQRIMVIVLHNSDVSDGWEREGENDEYFHKFSEKIAYPFAINLIFYLMTH
jgi:hypothetical protein